MANRKAPAAATSATTVHIPRAIADRDGWTSQAVASRAVKRTARPPKSRLWALPSATGITAISRLAARNNSLTVPRKASTRALLPIMAAHHMPLCVEVSRTSANALPRG